MILQALNDYYARLEADPDQDIAPFGFSRQKIAFCVVLEPDGRLHAIQDERVERNGKLVPRSEVVCGQAKPPGPGIKPCFLWDNGAYMLGFKPEDPKPGRTAEAFAAFRDSHLALRDVIRDDGFTAVCNFLGHWTPSNEAHHPILAEVGHGFGVFRLRQENAFVHKREAIRAYWERSLARQDKPPVMGTSLVSGDSLPLARLHEPQIKGVKGAQSSGAVLIGFNADAFTSYGKSKSYNAPVGEKEAFRYCTALNRLTSDNRRRVQVGDTTVVFWSDRPTPFEDMFGFVVGESAAEDERTNDEVRGFLNRLRKGRGGDLVTDGDVPFYVLGLSLSAAV